VSNEKIVFAAFEFDTATGELWRDGRRVRLQRQPSRLLELLTGRPGEVVTREEIRRALWDEDTHVDFERSLNFCVAKLRAALRDNAASPRFIETLPTRGYRFIATVRATDHTETLATENTDNTDRIFGSMSRSRWIAPTAVLVLVVAAFALWQYQVVSPPKIVVVPFHNETGSADLDRVAKGVSDATVARLATPERLPHLLVIGNASDLLFSFKPANMKAMGESLGAQYLLLGQMKKDDRRLRIVAHLIRVSDQTHLWAKTYDSDILDLTQQASIAEEIAKAVSATLAPSA
jgi:DNA-binding winged helix-turn-helix (wHTH) protein/TolB-like protein